MAERFGEVGFDFVLCKFWRSWWMWPWTFTGEVGRCLEMSCGVKPGQDLKWFFFMAVIMVDLTGDRQAAWMYWTSSMCVFSFWIMTDRDGLSGANFSGKYSLASVSCCLSISCQSMLSSISWWKWRNYLKILLFGARGGWYGNWVAPQIVGD